MAFRPVRMLGMICLEIDLSDGEPRALGELAKAYRVDLAAALASLCAFARNGSLLKELLEAKRDALVDALVQDALADVCSESPHLAEQTACPYGDEPAPAGGPFPCCTERPPVCLDFPLTLWDGCLSPAYDLVGNDEGMRRVIRAAGDQPPGAIRLEDRAALEEHLRGLTEARLLSDPFETLLLDGLVAGAELGDHELNAQDVVYLKPGDEYLLVDAFGPSVCDVGSES